jgi:hypothetical protein
MYGEHRERGVSTYITSAVDNTSLNSAQYIFNSSLTTDSCILGCLACIAPCHNIPHVYIYYMYHYRLRDLA